MQFVTKQEQTQHYANCVQAKYVVSPQTLKQEFIETKAIMCSQKIGSEYEGLVMIGVSRFGFIENNYPLAVRFISIQGLFVPTCYY